MGMSITSFKDAVKTLAQSLQLSTILPSMIFVLLHILLFAPFVFSEFDWSLSNEVVAISAIFVTVMLSYTLYAFNIPLIRLIEGYIGEDMPFVNKLRERQKAYYANLNQLKYSGSDSAKVRDAIQRLDEHFPSSSEDILPTKLGNTIAAFEDYPYSRYGIDAVVMWGRMIPILRENGFIEIISQEKAVFDFLLNMTFVVLVCGIEFTYLSIYLDKLMQAVAIALISYFIILFLYMGLISSALQWGTSVRVAFDLYRGNLWKALHLKPVWGFRDEVSRWEEISRLILLGKEALHFDLFDYSEICEFGEKSD